jgi:hypothetical protein
VRLISIHPIGAERTRIATRAASLWSGNSDGLKAFLPNELGSREDAPIQMICEQHERRSTPKQPVSGIKTPRQGSKAGYT